MTRRCQNPDCEYTTRCSIRAADAVAACGREITIETVPAAPPPEPAPVPSPTPTPEPWKDSIQFNMRPEPSGWTGILTVRGILPADLHSQLSGFYGDILEMSGLLIRFDTLGGMCGQVLHGLVLLAGTKMPVVGWVRQHCYSAGVLPLTACDVSCCSQFGHVGGFGICQGVCDGSTPETLVSIQSPQKIQPGTFYPFEHREFARNGDAERIQAELDKDYESDFRRIQNYTKADPQLLREYLDGRLLTPQEGMKIGLIDKIATEDTAYAKLLQLVNEREKP